MKKLTKIAVFASMTAMASTAFASPLSTATKDLFTSEADDIQNVNEFSNVKFEKYIASINLKSDTIDVCGAFKVGGIYFSPWYNGHIVAQNTTSSDSLTTTDTVDGNGNITSSTDIDTKSKSGIDNLNSTFNLLMGFGNVGVKLGYSNLGTSVNKGSYYDYAVATSTETTVKDDNGNVVYKNSIIYDEDGENGTKVNTPSVIAGTVFALEKMTLKPFAGFTAKISNAVNKGSYTTSQTPSVGTTTTTYTVDRENKTIALTPTIGTGIELKPTAKGFKHSFSFAYTPTFNVYSTNGEGDSSYFTNTKTYSKTADGTVTTSDRDSGNVYEYDSSNSHKIALGWNVEYEAAENLVLKAGFNPKISFDFDKYSTRKITKQNDVTSYTDGTKDVTNTYTEGQKTENDNYNFGLKQTLAGGLQYHVIPSKLDFNFGALVTLPTLSYSDIKTNKTSPSTTTTKTTSRDGAVSETKNVTNNGTSSSDTQTALWDSVSAAVSLGLTWFINENMNIDTALDMGIDGSSDSIFNNSLYIGCTLKF